MVGDGEGVAGVEDPAAVDEVADVGDARDVRVDHGVQFAVDLDVEAGGGERVAVADGVHAARERGRELLGDGLQRPDLRGRVGVQGRPQPLLAEVVGVLVRDEDRVRAEGGVLLAEGAGVEDERAAVLLQTDTGVRLLRELHGSILPRAGAGARAHSVGVVSSRMTCWATLKALLAAGTPQ